MAISSVTALVVATLAGGSPAHTRCLSDLDGHNLEFLAHGAAKCRVPYVMLGDEQRQDANTTYRQYELSVWSHYRLSVGQAERAWTEATMETYMRQLASPAYWRALAGVHDVVEGQNGITIIEPEREGHVITWGVRVRLSVTV